MSSFNRVTLYGNVGKTPESRVTASGSSVVTCSLATSSYRKGADGERAEETQWHRLVGFGKVGEVMEAHVEAGDRLLIEGKLTYRNYTDKDGNKRTTTEIIVDQLVFGGKASPAPRPPPPPPRPPPPAPAPDAGFGDLDDDIPF